MKKTVLLYNFDTEQQRRAKAALLPLHCAVKAVGEEEMLLPVGYLAGLTDNGEKRQCEGEFTGRLLVMGGFDSSDINRLLAAMKKAGFGRDIIKAVITPTNAVWCGTELYAEVYREHLQLHGKQ